MPKFVIVLLTLAVVLAVQFIQSVGAGSNAGYKDPVLFAISDNALLMAVLMVLTVAYLIYLPISFWRKKQRK